MKDFSKHVVVPYKLSSPLVQLLFSFGRGMRIEKTLIQTFAC
jgi:hypothetical protein